MAGHHDTRIIAVFSPAADWILCHSLTVFSIPNASSTTAFKSRRFPSYVLRVAVLCPVLQFVVFVHIPLAGGSLVDHPSKHARIASELRPIDAVKSLHPSYRGISSLLS